MIKLYRRDPARPGRVEYWEAWQAEPRVLTLHRGEIGDIGLTAQVRVGRFKNPDKVLAAEADEARAEGYEDLPADGTVQVVLQFEMDPDPAADPLADLDRVTAAEALCDEVLGWTGNGHCDGHDFGAGTMNVFLETVLPDLAVTSLVDALEKGGERDYSLAVRVGEDFVTVWPEQA